MITATKAAGGRRLDGKNRGFWYRAGRGWGASEGKAFVPLTNESGAKLLDRHLPAKVLQAAFARYLVTRHVNDEQISAAHDFATLECLCKMYLDQCKSTNADSTYRQRAGLLFDFCTGFPPRFRHNRRKAKPADRIHEGFGILPLKQLIPLHVDRWLQAHKLWGKHGGARSAVQALKRCLNYAVESGAISRNPIKGYKVAKPQARNTYITPEQEAGILKIVRPPFAKAMKVLIRTGARYGCEFAVVTADTVHDHGKRMEWIWPDGTKVKGKKRVIKITDPEIIEIVRAAIKLHPRGPIFRNGHGKNWTKEALSSTFKRIRKSKRLKQLGVVLDPNACMYSFRHTYAKRTLQGYWTGKPCNIETLSKLMGHTRDVCWTHYAEWDETYSDPQWEAC